MRTDVIRKETLRYLGLGSAEPDEKTLEMVNMVMKEIAELGLKDITIAASSLGSAHDPVQT